MKTLISLLFLTLSFAVHAQPLKLQDLVVEDANKFKYTFEQALQDPRTAKAAVDTVVYDLKHMEDLVNATVVTKGPRSWFLGDNIPGKPRVVLFYFGGAGAYRAECNEVVERGFEGFAIA